jgi:hypothetical protein
MDPFSALSNAAATRMIPPLREAPPAKVTSCALIASTDFEKALDAAKEVIGGTGVASAIMGGQPTKSPGRPAAVGGRLTPPSRWASHHLSARVPLLPRAIVCAMFVRFPLVRRSGKSTIQSCPHVLLRVSSPQRR